MSMIVKRSVSINGHRTSYSLEQPFYDELMVTAAARGVTLAALVASVDAVRTPGVNLSSALRLFVLAQVKQAQVRS